MSRIRSLLPFIAVAAIYWFAIAAIPAAYAQTAEPLPPEATPAVVAAPVIVNVAQPATPIGAPDPWINLANAAPYLLVIVLLVAVILFLIVDRQKLAVALANSIPATLWPSIKAGVTQFEADAGRIVLATPSTADDALWGEIRDDLNDLKARVQVLQDAKASVPDGLSTDAQGNVMHDLVKRTPPTAG